jgi:hypothetical protein
MIRRTFLLAMTVSCVGPSNGMAQIVPSTAETVSTATIGLRGGFDSNPTDILGARGSPLFTQTFDYAYLRGSQQDAVGLKLNAVDTLYNPTVAAPTTTVVAAATAVLRLAPELTLRTTLTTTLDDSWARRSHAVQLRERFEDDTPQFRLFTNFDVSLSSLNERDIFTNGGFLPYDENFVTVTALPGFAYKIGPGEIGASVALSRVSYFEDDILGLDRSHDVVQPNLFFSTSLSGFQLEGSVSPYFADFDTGDFDPVRQVLYTAKIKYPTGPWTFGIASTRTMQDTTLPFSAVDEALAHEGSASYKIDDHNAVNVLARFRRDDYLGLGAWATTLLMGCDFAHDFGGGFLGTASTSIRQVKHPGETLPWSLNVQFGLQKQLDFGAAQATPNKAADAKIGTPR